jgi:hypothetical protein
MEHHSAHMDQLSTKKRGICLMRSQIRFEFVLVYVSILIGVNVC